MSNVINIPNISRDARIGSVFKYLFKIINDTDNADGDVVWDFANAGFSHPFFLAPLSIYMQSCGKSVKILNCTPYSSRYLNLIYFEKPFRYFMDTVKDGTLQGYIGKTYTPICSFDAKDTLVSSRLQHYLQEVIKKQTNYPDKLRTPLSYLLGELVCNIEQHSEAKHGFLFSQYLKREGCLNVCIADDGITVYNSYINTGMYLDEIGNSEAQALIKANSGCSTKKVDERGFGLRTSHRLLTEGLGGAFFMLSGNAFIRITEHDNDAVDLPPQIRWNGTIILLRIPVSVRDGFDFYKYLE